MWKQPWLFIVGLLMVTYRCAAESLLTASSLVTCMDNSQISPSYFNVSLDPSSRKLTYSLDLTTEISDYIVAKVQVYAYGFVIIERDIDVCDLGWKQFCPIYPGNMQVESVEYISKKYIDMIPGIAYQVPDIDAVVKLTIEDRSSKQVLSCLQTSFTNGKTVSQTGAKWATAVIAGLGLLIAAILSTFGNSNAASHISANAVSLFLYFQAVVVVSMQHVERMPPIASSWAENLAWSMGLIRVNFMQKIFRWYIQATGGTPTTYFLSTTRQILVQRSLDFLKGIANLGYNNNDLIPNKEKRSLDFGLSSNANLIVLRGIDRIGYNAHIEPTSIVVTGFTFFVLCGFVLVVCIVLVKQLLELLIRLGKLRPNKLTYFRLTYKSILKGSLLRYIYIGFTQLVILSLWEFTQNDSPAVIVLAVLFLLLSLGLIGYAFWRTLTYGKQSIKKFQNPAALLYGDSRILERYGFCYTMFHAEKYWYGIVLVGYNLLKAIFIGLCQYSGKTSVLVIFILDLAYTIYLIIQAPYLNKATNIVNYLISVVNTLNAFFFLFFSDLFNQVAPVSSIMGWIFFVLNAAFSLILLVMIIVLIALGIVSKNPDARFAPAKDDRTSFQRKSSIKNKNQNLTEKNANELLALGIAAQDHTTNWEEQMYSLNNASKDSEIDTNQKDLNSPDPYNTLVDSSHDSNEDEKAIDGSIDSNKGNSLGLKLKTIVGRTLSTKRKGQEDSDQKEVHRISDTLNNEENFEDVSKEFPKYDSKTRLNHIRNESNFSSGNFSQYSSSEAATKANVL